MKKKLQLFMMFLRSYTMKDMSDLFKGMHIDGIKKIIYLTDIVGCHKTDREEICQEAGLKTDSQAKS